MRLRPARERTGWARILLNVSKLGPEDLWVLTLLTADNGLLFFVKSVRLYWYVLLFFSRRIFVSLTTFSLPCT